MLFRSPLTINNLTINEGSPFAVFTVTGATGQYVKLALADGTAKVDANGTPLTDGTEDYGPALEYFNGTNWVAYTANSFVQIPAGGTTLLVRTSIVNDAVADNAQTFTLTATNTGTSSVVGTATIYDDGTGNIFSGSSATPTANVPATSLNDDRPLTVTAVAPTVNEGSPYAAFVVSGAPDQLASLSLPTNTNSPLTTVEYWDGSAWVPYSAGDLIPLDNAGKALVRVLLAPEQDTGSDNSEPFSLTATNTGGTAATPAAVTIKDDGSGTVFTAADPSSNLTLTTVTAPTPVSGVVVSANAADLPNDDRALSIAPVTVNEASPYAIFKIVGATGQYTTLSLASGTAIISADTGSLLQYFEIGRASCRERVSSPV